MNGSLRDDVRQDGAPQIVTPRERLAGFWNSWFYPHEIEAAHAMAATASDEECVVELDRLEKQRKSRLESWRWSQ